MALDLARLSDTLSGVDTVAAIGRVRSVVGLTIEADIPGIRLGSLCAIERRTGAPLLAEVVGFRDHAATLMALGRVEGLGADDVVRPTEQRLTVSCSEGLLGRVLDGLGRPLDEGPALEGERREVASDAPNPLHRPRIARALATGVRALDAFATLGEGQRLGVFAGSGVGKSTLLGQIARQAEADVFVACLVGERSRELNEFLHEALGAEGRRRGVAVCAQSDSPPLVRMKCPYVATAIAEWFRDRGQRVLLLLDSLTRFARAARDVGLAAGEAPVRRGYPPSVFAALPGLLERAGTAERGSITAIYSVLVEGDDLDEPIADELRGLLDGHVVLSRELASRGHFPAIDVTRSLSRSMDRVAANEHKRVATEVRAHLAHYAAKRELLALGAYVEGSDPRFERARERIAAIEAFLRQAPDEPSAIAHTLALLERLA